jgi:hypothetical protein
MQLVYGKVGNCKIKKCSPMFNFKKKIKIIFSKPTIFSITLYPGRNHLKRICLLVLLICLYSSNAFQQTIQNDSQDNLKHVKVFSFLGYNIVFAAKISDQNHITSYIPVRIVETDYFTGDNSLYIEKWMAGANENWKGKPFREPSGDLGFENWMFLPFEWGTL